MAAISKEKLGQLEAQLGLTEDGLTYQQRCSRVSAMQKGTTWAATKAPDLKRGTIASDHAKTRMATIEDHPLYGQRLLITPMMVPDKNRALYFDEPVGPDVQVEEVQAGTLLYGAADDIDRMVGDYKVIRSDPSKTITAKTTLPKSGQEISWLVGKELVPVVRGNDGQRGYVWTLPTHMRQYGDTMIQIYGLKTLIQQIYPELLGRFSGKPVMMYVDGLVLAASIPQTDAILKEQRRKEIQDDRLGLV
jgi:hypothetical protein